MKNSFFERFNQRNWKCPRKVYSLRFGRRIQNDPCRISSNRDLSSATRRLKEEKKTNNVIASDHVINVRRKVHTNSIICPQLSCTMHQNRGNFAIHFDETFPRTINNDFFLPCAGKLMEVNCLWANRREREVKKRMTTAILPLELCRCRSSMQMVLLI